MDASNAGLDAAGCAAAIAPELDRLRLTVADRVKGPGLAVAAAHGIEAPAMMIAAYLRNVYPDRPFDPHGVLAVFTYQSVDQAQAGLDALVATGHLSAVTPTAFELTASGRSLLHDVVRAGDRVAADLWSAAPGLDAITSLAERAVAAIDDGGDTVAVMAPSIGNPAGHSRAGWFSELLSALRFHRFDSHIAAWQAAGLTLEQIKNLGPGPERDAIEADTNRRAATPYRALTSAEREHLLAGLASL
jgi:hypothetical protein